MALRDFVAARRATGRLLAAAIFAAALVPQLAAAAKPAKPAPTSTATDTWAATWEAAPEPPRAPFVALNNQTVRQLPPETETILDLSSAQAGPPVRVIIVNSKEMIQQVSEMEIGFFPL